MTDFGSALETVGLGAYMTDEDLSRALRYAIADEYEAIQIYSQISEATEDPAFRAVIDDIISEEKKHASQFWDLLARVDPDEHARWDEAVKENKRLMASVEDEGTFKPVTTTEEVQRRTKVRRVSYEETEQPKRGMVKPEPFNPRGIASIDPESQQTRDLGESLTASEIELYLKGIEYPVDKNGLLQAAALNAAPESVMDRLQRLPDQTYTQANLVDKAVDTTK